MLCTHILITRTQLFTFASKRHAAFSLTFRMFITDADTEWLFFSLHVTVIQVCPVMQVVCYGLKYFFNSVTFLCRNLEVMLYFMIMSKFIRRVGTQACMSCVCEMILVSKLHWGQISPHLQSTSSSCRLICLPSSDTQACKWHVHECSSCVWWFGSVQLQRCPK